jgi:ceramide glucosyltransferase
LLPVLAGAYAAARHDLDIGLAAASLLAVWFGTEAVLAGCTGWYFSWRMPLALLLRDLSLPFLWIVAWLGNDFVWRGTSISMPAGRADPQEPAEIWPG